MNVLLILPLFFILCAADHYHPHLGPATGAPSTPRGKRDHQQSPLSKTLQETHTHAPDESHLQHAAGTHHAEDTAEHSHAKRQISGQKLGTSDQAQRESSTDRESHAHSLGESHQHHSVEGHHVDDIQPHQHSKRSVQETLTGQQQEGPIESHTHTPGETHELHKAETHHESDSSSHTHIKRQAPSEQGSPVESHTHAPGETHEQHKADTHHADDTASHSHNKRQVGEQRATTGSSTQVPEEADARQDTSIHAHMKREAGGQQIASQLQQQGSSSSVESHTHSPGEDHLHHGSGSHHAHDTEHHVHSKRSIVETTTHLPGQDPPRLPRDTSTQTPQAYLDIHVTSSATISSVATTKALEKRDLTSGHAAVPAGINGNQPGSAVKGSHSPPIGPQMQQQSSRDGDQAFVPLVPQSLERRRRQASLGADLREADHSFVAGGITTEATHTSAIIPPADPPVLGA